MAGTIRRRRHQGGRRKDHPCVVEGCNLVTGDVRRHLQQFHKLSKEDAKLVMQGAKDVTCR